MKNVKPLLTYLVAFAAFALVDRFLFDHPVIQVLAMASLVLFAAQLLRLILGCLKPKERKGMTLISLLSSLLHYVAAIVIGIFLLFENQYNVGDIVEVNGFRGTVKEIGIRTTSIVDTGDNIKIINNSEMKNILNRSDNISRAVSDIAIPYETDLEALEAKLPKLMEDIYEARKDVMEAAPRYLGVQQLADSSVILRFVVDVAEKDIYTGARILNRDLWLGFRKLGVECPFPQVDVHSK